MGANTTPTHIDGTVYIGTPSTTQTPYAMLLTTPYLNVNTVNNSTCASTYIPLASSSYNLTVADGYEAVSSATLNSNYTSVGQVHTDTVCLSQGDQPQLCATNAPFILATNWVNSVNCMNWVGFGPNTQPSMIGNLTIAPVPLVMSLKNNGTDIENQATFWTELTNSTYNNYIALGTLPKGLNAHSFHQVSASKT